MELPLKNKVNKVILISLTNSMGGAEQLLLTIANTVECRMIFLKKIKRQGLPLKSEQHVEYVSKKSLVLGFLLLSKTLFKYRKGCLIISSHAYLNAFLGFLKRIGYLKSKLVVRESTSLFSRYSGLKLFTYKAAYNIGYSAVDLVVCQTNSMRNEFLQNNRYFPEYRTITIPNAINLDAVKRKAGEHLIDPLSKSEFICAAGRLIKIKGFDVLIEAFSSLAVKKPNLNLLILGEGPERGNLVKLVEQLGLKGRVFLSGYKSNPFPYFKRAKVCAVSSLKEGFPNVLLQMAALNTKVVSTICADGIEEIPCITKVKPGNVAALNWGIVKALNKEEVSGCTCRMDFYLSQRTPSAFVTALFEKINILDKNINK